MHAAGDFTRCIEPKDRPLLTACIKHFCLGINGDAAARVMHFEPFSAKVKGRLLQFLQKPRSSEIRIRASPCRFVIAGKHFGELS